MFLGLLELVLTTEKGDVGGGSLHGVDERFLLTRADDVDKLIGGDFIIQNVSDGLVKMFRKSRANENGDIRVR